MRNKRAMGIVLAGALALLVGLGPTAQGQAGDRVTLTEKTFTAEERVEAFSGAVDSRALRIAIDGLGELALAQGASTIGYQHTITSQRAPSLDTSLFVDCDDPQAVTVDGSERCLNPEELSNRGVETNGSNTVAVEGLVQKGIAQLETVADSDNVTDQQVTGDVTGLLIGGEAQAQATCDNADPGPKAESGFAIPEEFAAVVTGTFAAATCESNPEGFPFTSHGAGEADLGITLNETLATNLPVDETLDGIQDQLGLLPEDTAPLTDPVNNVIDAIQEELSSNPLATVHVAPNGGELTSNPAGVVGTSQAVAVDTTVLGGILEITVGTADTAASILDQEPTTKTASTTAHVKALNILDPEGEPLIDQEIDLSQGEPQTILEGTPLQSTIGVLSTEEDSGCEVVDDVKTCTADSGASALSLSLLEGDALPTITLELADAGTQVQGQYTTTSAQPNLPLARTGAATLPTIFAGGGLIALAAVVRRRFL